MNVQNALVLLDIAILAFNFMVNAGLDRMLKNCLKEMETHRDVLEMIINPVMIVQQQSALDEMQRIIFTEW